MRHSFIRILSLASLAAVLSLTINFSVRSSFASGYDPVMTIEHQTDTTLFDVAAVARPPCLRCGGKTAYTPDIPIRPHSIN